MANQFPGSSANIVSLKSILQFRRILINLVGLFSNDFSDANAGKNQTVDTDLVPRRTAQDLDDVHAGDYEEAAGDSTFIKKSVTLSEHPIEGFNIKDDERSAISNGVWAERSQKNLEQTVNAVALVVHDFLMNLITVANFAAVAKVIAPANFDADAVTDIRTAIMKADFNFMDARLIINSDNMGGLLKDDKIKDDSASRMNTLMSGIVSTIGGMSTHEAPNMPPAGGTPAAENLTGFVAAPQAISIAMRAVEAQSNRLFENYETLVDPETNLILVYARWYTTRFRKMFETIECLFGAAPGDPDALQRVTSV